MSDDSRANVYLFGPFRLDLAERSLERDGVAIALLGKAYGTDARLLIGKAMQHDFPLTLPWLEESRGAWQAMCQFVDACCASEEVHVCR